MNIKEQLLKLKYGLTGKGNDVCEEVENESMYNTIPTTKNYSLDKKINDFVDWYYREFVKGKYTNIGEFSVPKQMKDTIDKYTVWYELRYPEYEVNKLYPGSAVEINPADDVFLKNNKAIKEIEELMDEKEKKNFSDAVGILEWSNLLSTKTFLSSLPWDEKWFLSKPKYSSLVYIDPNDRSSKTGHLHLTAKGFVSESEIIKNASFKNIEYYDFKGMHITEVIKYFKDNNMNLPENNELEKAVSDYNKKVALKERFLDCVMYRIIERDGKRIGPRRAFMFAKEFERNIDVPMIYGIDYSDPGLRSFIFEYIKAGGDMGLNCLVGYGARDSEDQELEIRTVEDIIGIKSKYCVNYTPEEKELHQRLVNILKIQEPKIEPLKPDSINAKNEEIKQKRITRRIEKSKTRNN